MPAEFPNSIPIPILPKNDTSRTTDDLDSDTDSSSIGSSHPSLEPGPRQCVHVQDVTYKSQPKWKNVLYLPSSHSPWWKTLTSPQSDATCPDCSKTKSVPQRRPRHWKGCSLGILVVTLVLAFVALLSVFTGVASKNGVDRLISLWGTPGQIGEGLSSWPTDFSSGIDPIPCHSHNDYWRRVPLYSAISAGCIGVEADIWLYEEELYVGHKAESLTRNRTLNNLYINPLIDILSHQNPINSFYPQRSTGLAGVFDTNPSQSLILLIDFKSAGEATWPYVLSALQPLRDRNYLTHLNGTEIINGPITVVGTGNTPFHLVASEQSNPHLDVFFDAPLDQMRATGPQSGNRQDRNDGSRSNGTASESFTAMNSYYASVSFVKVFGHLSGGRFSDKQLATLRDQILGTHMKGLKSRYWELPHWPISLRNHVWDVLVKEGVDILNVDDLKGATDRDWTQTKRWWSKS
ncbi:Altered inheritance of mitochondria protein 6 [Pseudocyphellaria aurata]|nr:Altered inheritance of mitochondria protein 6 [Pseudocyphellaria aurata]